MPSKSILIILSYTVLKLVRFLRHSVELPAGILAFDDLKANEVNET